VLFTTAFLEHPLYIDKLAITMVESIKCPELTMVFNYITNLGAPVTFEVLGFISFIYLVLKGERRAGFILIGGLVGSWVIMDALKIFFGRPRPAGEHLTMASGMSFPSGHAMLSMVFYGFLAYLILRKLMPPKWNKIFFVILCCLILLIGLSRVYLNVHYITDVAAGFVLGALILIIMVRFYRYQ
jgi:undecaprenyl-diphosphatase